MRQNVSILYYGLIAAIIDRSLTNQGSCSMSAIVLKKFWHKKGITCLWVLVNVAVTYNFIVYFISWPPSGLLNWVTQCDFLKPLTLSISFSVLCSLTKCLSSEFPLVSNIMILIFTIPFSTYFKEFCAFWKNNKGHSQYFILWILRKTTFMFL